MNILEKITERKKYEVSKLKKKNSYLSLEKSSYFNMPSKNLAKRIKRECATGGSIKNNEIIIQGNKRDVVKTILEEEGFKPKLSGG